MTATIERPELIKAETISWRRMSLRNLAAHKVRLLLTVISVVLGTAFVAGSFVFTDTLHGAFNNIIGVSDKGVAVQIDTSSSQSAGVPLSVAQTVRSVAGVRAVELSASSQIVVIGPNGKKVESGGAPSEGSLYSPPGQSVTAPATFVSGTAPTAPGQVVINEAAASKAGLKVGNRLKIITLNSSPIDVTLTGIYKISTDTGGFVGVLFDQQQALQLFTDGSHVSMIRLAADPGVSQQALRDRVAAAVPSDLRVRTGDVVRTADENSLQKALSFVNIFLLAFGLIALLVGTFIIYNTFTMLVAQRLRELALLRAIGADRGQLLRSVLSEAAVIGLLGSIIGSGVGIGLALGLHAVLDGLGLGLPSSGVVVAPRTIIISLVLGVVVTVLSAAGPALRASRIPPVAAMREQFASTNVSQPAPTQHHRRCAIRPRRPGRGRRRPG